MFDHKKIVEDVSRMWEERKAYQRLKEEEKNRERKLYFLDGPPYVTGEIHPGTAWNKVMKDAVIRYYRMIGYRVNDKPGFDTHGLPIEVKVEKLLGIKNKDEIEKKVGIEKFIQECKSFAEKYRKIMTEQFKSFGVWMDWDNPYITFKDSYIEKSWNALKLGWKKRLLKEDVYVLPYCYRCETTLANYELEYKDKTSPSIFVKFPLKDREGEFLVIWTTTPWTLVANMAVMAHPDYEYVRVKTSKGEVWILAKERLDVLSQLTKESFIVLESMKGKDLSGLEYIHPFQDLIRIEFPRKVVLSDEFVTLEEGTGLVHTAPGHGPEDFKVGKVYGIPAVSPVDPNGLYTEEAGEFKGMNVYEANERIISILNERGFLVWKGTLRHRYPHCWRCKTPLIYRVTKQWFITITKLKERMKEEALKVEWVPKFAGERFRLFVEKAPDWCISRQRYWGIPLPIWKDEEGHVYVVGSKKELEELSGKKVKELHRPYVDELKIPCPECGKPMRRISDVLDVWFDSGNAPWASLTEEEEKIWGEVADIILEGQDQIRGWFYSLLGSGLIKYDQCSYRKVIMHGFFLDEKGEKMSKSLGNFIPVEEILERYGPDTFRLFTLSNSPWDDLKFSWDEMKIAHGELGTLLNILRYYQSSIHLTNTEGEVRAEDRYVISRLNSVLKIYHESFKSGHFHKAVRELRKFIMEDVSRFYLKLIKDRVRNGERIPLETLRAVLEGISLMLAPISPYVSDYIYVSLNPNAVSVHLQSLPEVDEGKIDLSLENAVEKAKAVVESVLRMRNEAGIKLRWPLSKLIVYDKSLAGVFPIIGKLSNVKEVLFSEEGEANGESAGVKFYLDLTLTEELKREGILNDIFRRIQFMRKKKGLKEGEEATLVVSGEEELISLLFENVELAKKRAWIKEIKRGEGGEEFEIEGKKIRLDLV